MDPAHTNLIVPGRGALVMDFNHFCCEDVMVLHVLLELLLLYLVVLLPFLCPLPHCL